MGAVTRLFARQNGRHGILVSSAPPELDIAAGRTDQRIYLHVLNTSYSQSVEVALAVQGMRITGKRVFEIAPEDPREYVN